MRLINHSIINDLHVLFCSICQNPMRGIYRADIRDTCTGCGGHAKIDRTEDRAEIKREQLARVREARRQ